MFTALTLFLKKKLFTTTGVFLMVFAALIGMFLVFNAGTILERFGFETKATVKAELAKTKKDIERLSEVNKDLAGKIEQLEATKKQHEQAISAYEQESKDLRKVIQEAKDTKKAKTKPNTTKVDKETVITDTTITLPKQAYEELSYENISTLHSVFDRLFPED